MSITVGVTDGILHVLEQLAQAPATDVNHLQNLPDFLRFCGALSGSVSPYQIGLHVAVFVGLGSPAAGHLLWLPPVEQEEAFCLHDVIESALL